MKSRGFTLIELMIVIAILAIIMAVAIPVYNSQVQKTRRADAQAALMDASQQLERCFTRTNSYTGCAVRADSPDEFYTVNANLTATTYTLSATPAAGGPQVGDDCGTYTLDHRGVKGDDGADRDRCWGT